MAKTALIVSISAGLGHQSNADDLADLLFEAGWLAHTIDAFSSWNRFAPIVPTVYRTLQRHSRAYTRAYAFTDTRPPKRAFQVLTSSFARQLTHYLATYNPSVIFVAAPLDLCAAVARARSTVRSEAKIVLLLSDLGSPHSSWYSPEVDHVIPPSEEVRSRLLKLGRYPESALQIKIPSLPMPPSRAFPISAPPRAGTLYVKSIAPKDHQKLAKATVNDSRVGELRQVSAPRLSLTSDCKIAVRHALSRADLIAAIASSQVLISKPGPSILRECLYFGSQFIPVYDHLPQERGNYATYVGWLKSFKNRYSKACRVRTVREMRESWSSTLFQLHRG